MQRYSKFANSAMAVALCLAGVVARADAPNWARQLRNDPGTNQTACVLVSATQTIYDGYQDTRIHLELGKGGLQVISESNFDTGGRPLGLSVDGGPFIASDKLAAETRLAFTHDMDRIIDQFIQGNTARIRLRFWPTWPATGDKIVKFSLLGFTRAYRSRCD
jgi:hypothetical protein